MNVKLGLNSGKLTTQFDPYAEYFPEFVTWRAMNLQCRSTISRKRAGIKIFPYICNTLKLILYDYYTNYLGSLVPYRRYCNQIRGKRELPASKRKMVGQI